MKTSDFDFHLPANQIAQKPSDKREESKLMLLNRADHSIAHHRFFNFVDFLTKEDVLVINNTKVLPARVFGTKKTTGAKIEVLLLKEIEPNRWESLVKPARKIALNDQVVCTNSSLTMTCVQVLDEGMRIFDLSYQGVFLEELEKIGTLPLPPYIKNSATDQNRYQTVYAQNAKSAAAPTAGLHFTDEILQQIKEKGIEIIEVTLEVGLGTFRPVNVDDVLDHHMHEENYEITLESAKRLNQAISNKKRLVAVGTTTVRVLESNFKNGFFSAKKSSTNIFIYPGYQFKVVSKMLTNFHLPKSTLLMLISAFYNKNEIIKAYHEAIVNKYRFFSFGDSMFIV